MKKSAIINVNNIIYGGIIMRYNIKTSGMGCDHCIAKVRKTVEKLGAKTESIELNDIIVDFEGDKSMLSEAIENVGFHVISIEEA